MNCQICNGPSNDKYCGKCRHIRCVYVIHKLLEKIPLNEKINTDILIVKKIKNIEKYDLELLVENELLIKDRYHNYRWVNIEKIEQYLKKHDKSNKKLKLIEDKVKKEQKIPTIDEVVLYIEKNYNMTESFDEDKLAGQLKTNKVQTKKIIKELIDGNLIKKSFYGQYTLNYHQIIKYKQKNKINENKIKTLKNIKQNPNEKDIKKTVISTQKSTAKTKKKSKKSTKKNSKTNKSNKQNIIKTSSKEYAKEDKIIPLIREYINSQLIILPRGVKDSDLTQRDLYDEFKKYNKDDISKDDFNIYFHRTINTYPHIRHTSAGDIIRYNVKSRQTPQITLKNIQLISDKFKYNEDTSVQLNENTLEVDTHIHKDEQPQLFNLMVYTHENIIEHTYQVKDDMIHIHITYDLSDENPDLWIKFLKSYNIYQK